MSLYDEYTYVEKEEDISHIYNLTRKMNVDDIYRTKRGVLEFVPTKKYGECLFIDNVLQVSLNDEYIYHELLVHPGMIASNSRSRVCIMGGGDGLAAREVFKWNDVNHIDLIDWDEEIVELFRTKYASWNKNSLLNPRLKHICNDIYDIENRDEMYNVLIIDLLDPDLSSELHIEHWTKLLKNARSWMAPKASLVMNAGGIIPWNTKHVEKLLEIIAEIFSDLHTHELLCYKGFVPSFQQEWCFILIQPNNSDLYAPVYVHSNLYLFKYYNQNLVKSSRDWSYNYANIPKLPVKLNKLAGWIQSRQYE